MVDSFLLALDESGRAVGARLDAARARLSVQFPDCRIERVETDHVWLGVLMILSTDSQDASKIGFATHGGSLCVAYGDLDRASDGSLAAALLEATADDVGGLADVDGCYGAVVVDVPGRSVLLVSDGLAQRAVRHVRCDQTVIMVSPHDLMLVAGGAPVKFDRGAFLSLVRIGWSFGGDSLVEGVAVVRAETIERLFEGRRDVLPHPSFERVCNRRAISKNVSAERTAIADAMIDFVASWHRPGRPLRVELSAGFDSRAVLATALAASPEDVEAFTDGPLNSQDVLVARRVAAAVGVPHTVASHKLADAEERLQSIDALAVATSGQATCMPVMTNPSRAVQSSVDSLGGDGAEVFRGYFYPKIGFGARRPFSIDAVADVLLGKSAVGRGILSTDEEAQLRQRVIARLAGWLPHCERHADGVDLLYLLERTGVWNQKLRRMPTRRSNPFYSRAATFRFLALSGVRGRRARVHEYLYRRFVPETLAIPVNGETIPALMVRGPVLRAIGTAQTLVAKGGWRFAYRFLPGRGGSGTGDLESTRKGNFLSHLASDWSTLFDAPESVTRSILGDEMTIGLLAKARAEDRRACDVLASLVVVERFFRLARAISSDGHLHR